MLGIVMAVTLQAAGATEPAVEPVSPRSTVWLKSPGPQDFQRAHPKSAEKEFLSGRATLACDVALDGSLGGCAVDEAEPRQSGFEQAALSLSPYFTMRPDLPTGSDRRGRKVRIPLYFRLPDDLRASPISLDHAVVKAGYAALSCRYRALRLDNCFVDSSTSESASTAAMQLAGATTLPETPRNMGRMSIAFQFKDPAAIEPSPGLAGIITRPDWIRTPTGADIVRVFPAQALRRGIDGMAVTSCKVAVNGTLTDCETLEEAPAGVGFGKAALALMPRFLMRPMTRDGQPVEGGTVRIPMRFVLPR
jgi:TonB family protein